MKLDKTQQEQKSQDFLKKILGNISQKYGKIFDDIGAIESSPYIPNVHVLSK